jgi:hypothetical protein
MTLEELDRKVTTMETKLSERWKFATERELGLKETLETCTKRIGELDKKPVLPRWVMPGIVAAFLASLGAIAGFIAGNSALSASVDNLTQDTIPAIIKQMTESNIRIEKRLDRFEDKLDRLYGAPAGVH